MGDDFYHSSQLEGILYVRINTAFLHALTHQSSKTVKVGGIQRGLIFRDEKEPVRDTIRFNPLTVIVVAAGLSSASLIKSIPIRHGKSSDTLILLCAEESSQRFNMLLLSHFTPESRTDSEESSGVPLSTYSRMPFSAVGLSLVRYFNLMINSIRRI